MRVFVSESLCSGAMAEEALPSSLLREGRAMRDALLADWSALDGVQVVTTFDPRVPVTTEGVEAHIAATAGEEHRLFNRLCVEADAVYVIAPELGGMLAA